MAKWKTWIPSDLSKFSEIWNSWNFPTKLGVVTGVLGIPGAIAGFGFLFAEPEYPSFRTGILTSNISEPAALEVAKAELGEVAVYAFPFRVSKHPSQFIVAYLGEIYESERFRSEETDSWGNIAILEGQQGLYAEHDRRFTDFDCRGHVSCFKEQLGLVRVGENPPTVNVVFFTRDFGSQMGTWTFYAYNPISHKYSEYEAGWFRGEGATFELTAGEMKENPHLTNYVAKKMQRLMEQ